MKTDSVNHPPHYTRGEIECIEGLAAATKGKQGIEAVCVANIIKYLWRLGHKGSALEDARKAQWYIDRLINELERQEEKEKEAVLQRKAATQEEPF